ncbi:MAG: hypothetical protein NTY01_10070 [Verrucomicrobia bacterium]|nr:hypothetical protein [Verrucomicrobiota bacterium]
MTLIIIDHFSGFGWLQLLDLYNLNQLVYINWFIGLPWLIGLGLGSLWFWLSEEHAKARSLTRPG